MMAIEFQITSDNENGTKTRSVWLMLKDGSAVRKVEAILNKEDDAAEVLPAQLSGLWAAGEAVPDGVQAWYAYKQRTSNAWFNKVIFAVFVQVNAGGDIPMLLAAANLVMEEDEMQKAIYEKLNTALQSATEAQFRQFVALALTVAYGKLGQR